MTGITAVPCFLYTVLETTHHHFQETAILLFSRSAVEESRVKSLDSGKGVERNRAIIRSLIRHSYATARKTGLPVFTCFSSQQEGNGFGERLTNAIESIFAQGYDRVITIGNDCPAISSTLLLDARNRLRENEMVLGPAMDGGVYLIGLNRRSWNPAKFQSLPWQSPQLQIAFANYATSLDWLEQFQDLDHEEDLFQFLLEAPLQHRLRLEILEIIGHSAHFYTTYQQILIPAALNCRPSLRAPPH